MRVCVIAAEEKKKPEMEGSKTLWVYILYPISFAGVGVFFYHLWSWFTRRRKRIRHEQSEEGRRDKGGDGSVEQPDDEVCFLHSEEMLQERRLTIINQPVKVTEQELVEDTSSTCLRDRYIPSSIEHSLD